MTESEFVQYVRAQRLIAIVRGPGAAEVEQVARVLFQAGIRLIELPLTTPDAGTAIGRLRHDLPSDVLIGAGTVLTEADVAKATQAGAQFIVTPCLADSLPAATSAGLPVICGAFSPAEVYLAHRSGAAIVKIFPASTGGPAHLKALRDPFPDIPLMPVGGVDLAEVPRYLTAGAIGVGVGGPLVGDAVRGGSVQALAGRAADFLAAVRS
jgi:2-dehydro-3-deoxyphosphogluconate aldolase/(4S)-4-hydroxy-2-oxoglutarate aldolase